MTEKQDPLEQFGFNRLDPETSPELFADLYRVARRVREAGRTVVGLMPTGSDVAVIPLAVELGFALADACEGVVAVVDANPRWPALQGIDTGKSDRSKKSGFVTHWLESFLAVITPTNTSQAMRLDGLDYLLTHETRGFSHMLVDLTGFEKSGEHWGLFDMIDGVLLIGHPGLTTERKILSLHDEIAASKMLGVILVG
ncbi:MAG: hypothetical protein FWD57_00430 [Polyangiaceae bacterium]|nr:hypothetical protein [Polyangiaceae bacterium]